MLVASSYPQLNAHLFATISRVIVPIFMAALLVILLPVALLAVLVDFTWFRLCAALLPPQPRKGLWEL